MTPLILFPSTPGRPRKIDEDFEDEQRAAREAGLAVALLDHTAVLNGDVETAAAAVPEDVGLTIYRGWMLKPYQYRGLYEALESRGVALINTPQGYQTCHYLPDSYPYIFDHTPRTVWFRSLDDLGDALTLFGDQPVIVKDWVKSQKHYWDEACFIPKASDRPAAQRVVNRFLELQGDDLNEGVVIRQYEPLKIVGQHPKSGMPLAAEYRIFWLNGQPILTNQYWSILTPYADQMPWEELKKIAAQIPSHFFTMDVAFLENDSWMIVELGDGQVAGLPSNTLAPHFYNAIRSL